MTTRTTPGRLTTIQGLRAFAALNVVLLHALIGADGAGAEPTLLGALRGWGAGGVDLFFVISGFIMIHVQRSRRRGPVPFLRERILRVAPLYWALTLLLWSVLLAAPALFGRFETSAEGVLASLLFVSQPLGFGTPTLYVGWTLELEMLFYAVFAASLLLPDLRLSAAATTGALALGILALGLPVLCLEFAMGMAAGLLRVHAPRAGLVAMAAGAAGLLASLPVSQDPSILDIRALVWGCRRRCWSGGPRRGRSSAPRSWSGWETRPTPSTSCRRSPSRRSGRSRRRRRWARWAETCRRSSARPSSRWRACSAIGCWSVRSPRCCADGGRGGQASPETETAACGSRRRRRSSRRWYGISAWRTGSSGGPCGGRTSCAPPRGRRG